MHELFSEDIKIQIAKQFNKKPKDGINAIIRFCDENGIENVDKQIAEFFIEQKENLDLEAVGDYLSGENILNQKVLKAFTQQFNFQNKTFTEVLREFLFSHKLPGEVQKIDRLVQSFSDIYYGQQQESAHEQIFSDADAVYVLAFQTIMLNTDLHNSAIKDHMSIDSLKQNLRGVNGGENFPDEFLLGLYEEIKENPFEFNFTKISPGIQMNTSLLDYDQTFKSLKTFMNEAGNGQLKNVFPNISNADSLEAQVDKPRSLLANLMGYNGTLNLTDKETGAKCSVQIYEPNIFSKILFNDKPKIIIQPLGDENQDHSLKLAAQVAASFRTPPETFKSTYGYEADSMEKEYRISKSAIISKSHVSNIESGQITSGKTR